MTVKYMAAILSNFCDQVGWTMIQFIPNEKNNEQLHAVIIDEKGHRFDLIATKEGNYYKLLGNKKIMKIDQKALLDDKKTRRIW